MAQPPMASSSIVRAMTRPQETTLAVLFEEYRWSQEEEILEHLFELEQIFSHFDLACEPPIGAFDLDHLRVVSSADASGSLKIALRELEAGEGPSIEFKETLYLDTKKYRLSGKPIEQCHSDDVLISSLKTISAYLNTNGGTLYVGVNDDGVPTGLSVEYPLVSQKTQSFDQWELFFRAKMEKFFYSGRALSSYVKVERIEWDGVEFARIQVPPKTGLSFMKFDQGSALYVRTGNRTLSVGFQEIEDYFELGKRYV